jgi:Mn-dependent DtxR family transcriptional regulator
MRALDHKIKETFADEFDKAYEEPTQVDFGAKISAEEKVEKIGEPESTSVQSKKLEDVKASSKTSKPFERAFALVLEGA